jgi:prefoldin subunit 5
MSGEEEKDAQRPKVIIPITEDAVDENTRKIPKVLFIDNTEAWVEKYSDDALFAQMNELYQKYKYMESNLVRARMNLKVKLPDIKRTLEMVCMLKAKHESEDKSMNTNFLLADNIWAKAKIPNTTGNVGLWLGANVMVEYTYIEAVKLLGANLANAEAKIKETEADLDFLKDQLTTTEVNLARIYNQGVLNNKKK